MKKRRMIALFAALTMAGASLTGLAGCGLTDLPSPSQTASRSTEAPSSLEGTVWRLTGAIVDGETLTSSQISEKFGSSMEDMTLAFQGGEVYARAGSSVESTSYSYTSGKLTIENGSGTVSGNTMQLSVSDQTMIMEKVEGADVSEYVSGQSGISSAAVENAPASLEGTVWRVISVNRDGTTMTNTEYTEKYLGYSGDMTLAFQGGMVYGRVGSQVNSAQYSYENGVIKGDGDTGTVSGRIMKLEESGMTMTLELVDGASVSEYMTAQTSSASAATAGAPASLEGTVWKITGVIVDGQTMSADQFDKDYSGNMSGTTMAFQGGTVYGKAGGEVSDISYSYAGGSLTIDDGKGTVSGNTMQIDVEGITLILEKIEGASVSDYIS